MQCKVLWVSGKALYKSNQLWWWWFFFFFFTNWRIGLFFSFHCGVHTHRGGMIDNIQLCSIFLPKLNVISQVRIKVAKYFIYRRSLWSLRTWVRRELQLWRRKQKSGEWKQKMLSPRFKTSLSPTLLRLQKLWLVWVAVFIFSYLSLNELMNVLLIGTQEMRFGRSFAATPPKQLISDVCYLIQSVQTKHTAKEI